MANDEEVMKRILEAVQAKLGQHDARCSLCGHNQWAIGSRFVVLSASKSPRGMVLGGGEGFPLVPIICQHCGNAHLLNLLVLGFTEKDFDSLGYS